jgi:hypothetical protein
MSVCLICLVASFVSSEAQVYSYVEDFTTLDYCDTLNTTAWWDTLAGEVKLPPFEHTLAGSCDTPGDAYDVAVSGNYAYVADQLSGLQVIDISDPTNPTSAGSYDTPGSAYGVAISGDYAYVADRLSGLQTIDISDPENPTLAGGYDTPSDAMSVAISGDYAYVADFMTLQVINISDPTNPTLAGSCSTPGTAWRVDISGDYAYIADRDSGLQVIDISDPANPTLAGSYDTPGNAYGVAVSGDHAYVADGGSGLQVIDISDPTNPTLAGGYDTPAIANEVAVSGNYAYVADHNSGLQILDISDPATPVLRGSYDTPHYATGVAISGEHACVTDRESGLLVIDICDSTDPVLAGSYNTPGSASGVAVSGDLACVADYYQGLHVIDISDPTGPTLLGSYDTPGRANRVAISGDYAYVADYEYGLQVIDISDPTNPTLAGNYNTPGSAYNIAISGDYAYVADYSSGLRVVDISVPTNPTSAGSYDTPGTAYGVTVSGDYAYIADSGSGLRVIDISNPAVPTSAGSYDTPGYAWAVAISGDYAYVADGDSGLQVMDISDPTNPARAGNYPAPWFVHYTDVAISGDYACVAASGGMVVMDISVPTNPVLTGTYADANTTRDLVISGDHVYAPFAASGLLAIGIFQQQFVTGSNAAWSLLVDDSDASIAAARLSSTQTDSIRWEVSADSGANWQEFRPGRGYEDFTVPGSDLLWRSHHVYAPSQPGVNPTCSDLTIEWLFELPVIESISDIPGDQGRQVRIEWLRCAEDEPSSSTPIAEYAIFRRIDQAAAPPADQSVRRRTGAEPDKMIEDNQDTAAYPPGDWDFVKTVPAYCEDSYSTVVPTLADSTQSEGIQYSVFFIRAGTAEPSIYVDSYPDSGYSVDNLAPAAPLNLTMSSATDLAWDECPDEDFNYFSIYGSAVATLDTNAVLIGYTVATVGDVSGHSYGYYHVTATDFAGNEGDASSVENTYAGVNRGEDLPRVFALKQNRPNPFGSSTKIDFDLPEPCAVRLEVLDVQGRVVRVLTDEAWPAGRHSVTWTGGNHTGQAVGPGVFFVRIQAGDFTARNKMLLMK